MAATRRTTTRQQRTVAPARTIEGRENQLIALAIDLVEEKLRDRTASSQEVVHFLKLGTSIARLEREKLERENSLLQAKTEALNSQKKSDELFREAMQAFQRYSGRPPEEPEDSDEFEET